MSCRSHCILSRNWNRENSYIVAHESLILTETEIYIFPSKQIQLIHYSQYDLYEKNTLHRFFRGEYFDSLLSIN